MKTCIQMGHIYLLIPNATLQGKRLSAVILLVKPIFTFCHGSLSRHKDATEQCQHGQS
jgi:hypothetical protein